MQNFLRENIKVLNEQIQIALGLMVTESALFTTMICLCDSASFFQGLPKFPLYRRWGQL